MLNAYLNAAMRQAHYEIMENGRFFGKISGFQGIWGEGESLETCRDELIEVLEGWILVSLRAGDDLPVVGGIDLNQKLVHA